MTKEKVTTPGLRFLLACAAGISFGLVLPSTGVAASDAYIDALKAEVADAPEKRLSPGQDAQPAADRSQEEMEEWLRTDFVGSYMFYQSMPDVKKRMVYKAYRSGATITELRQKILDLLKQ